MSRCIRIALRSFCAFAATLGLAQTVTFTLTFSPMTAFFSTAWLLLISTTTVARI
jgi:hypothetical protein